MYRWRSGGCTSFALYTGYANLNCSLSVAIQMDNHTFRDLQISVPRNRTIQKNHPPSSMPVALPTIIWLQISRYAAMNLPGASCAHPRHYNSHFNPGGTFNGQCTCFRPWIVCSPSRIIRRKTIVSRSGMERGVRQWFGLGARRQALGKRIQWTHPNGACLHTSLTQGVGGYMRSAVSSIVLTNC